MLLIPQIGKQFVTLAREIGRCFAMTLIGFGKRLTAFAKCDISFPAQRLLPASPPLSS